MPTPVTAARQCLTDSAAAALDAAVSVARRRNHQQTTSLHAVAALLSPPSSLLRSAVSLSSPSRRHFRALEISVNASLDRLATAPRTLDDDQLPPISNSLMAAIKRSQANQRRQPEMYQFHVNCGNSMSISSIKVELKHFVLSILDDPIVSRVFGEVGFRSGDIKIAIIRPPLTAPEKYFQSRWPPVFLCNMMDSGEGDGYCRRIGEVLVREKGRNPVLVGVCAKDALFRFKKCVEMGKIRVLPSEIHGLKLVCFEKEISEIVVSKGKDEILDMKVKELSFKMEDSGPGAIVNVGELKVLMEDDCGLASRDAVDWLVLKLSELIKVYGKRLWVMGAAASDDIYRRFLERFPMVERDWDLYPFPITSSGTSVDGLCSKSSLMGSFVPFGGFFPTTSDFRNPFSIMSPPSTTNCNFHNDKCEQELSVMSRGGSSASVSNPYSASLPSWFHVPGYDASKGGDEMAQAKDVTTSNPTTLGLQRKWDDFYQFHHGPSKFKLELPHAPGIQLVTQNRASSSGNSHFNEKVSSNSSPCLAVMAQDNADSKSSAHPLHSSTLPPDRVPSSSVNSVITELGLGTLYKTDKTSLNQNVRSPEEFDPDGYKLLYRKLTERVGWQGDTISQISQILSSCGRSIGVNKMSNTKGTVWLGFLGPDRIGKWVIAEALADVMFGNRDNLIAADLNSQDGISEPSSVFICKGLNNCDVNIRGKTVIDHIAEELRKKPHSVVFLENVDKADVYAQTILFNAIQAGKFLDSYKRETSIKNAVFITASGGAGDDEKRFSEERVLKARKWQMQVVVGNQTENESIVLENGSSRVAYTNKRKRSDICHLNANLEVSDRPNKVSRNYLDLNQPIKETEEDAGTHNPEFISDESRSWFDDFLSQVNGKVTFKPFDFDALADKLLTKISSKFAQTISNVMLEIHYEIMLQILAVSWSSEREGEVEEWIEQVLGSTFNETRERYPLSTESVVKLVPCEGTRMSEPDSDMRLPKRVILR